MTATLLDSDTFAFADGNSGHSCNLGSAPNVGEWDVLCVNSDTVVTTPTGFTLAPSNVGGQGAYIYRREASGGEGSTVTITTSGNHPCVVQWSRWGSINAADQADVTAEASEDNETPAHSTGTLAETDELVIAFAALHSIGAADQTSPVWSSGYTALTEAVQGSGVTGTRGYVGYRLDAGTASESPQVSWSGGGCDDRYMLTLTFTTESAVEVDADSFGQAGITGAGAGDRESPGVATGAAGVSGTAAGAKTSGSAGPGAGGMAGTAAAGKQAPAVGMGLDGVTGSGVAAKVAPAVSTGPAAVTGTAVGVRAAATASTAAAGIVGSAASTRTSGSTGRAAAGVNTSGSGRKVVASAAVLYAGVAARTVPVSATRIPLLAGTAATAGLSGTAGTRSLSATATVT